MNIENEIHASVGSMVRQRLSLDTGWRFHLGDIPVPEIKGHGPTYSNAKAGKAWGSAAPEFDDSEWRRLDLPHDWVVEGPFDEAANISQGYRPRGVAWYRRHFRLEEADRGKHLEVQFDGIATHATVWINGLLAHRNFCGYTSFSIDLTPIATYGDDLNTIAVRVDAGPMEGWWYEGGGIYRHTWLVKRDAVHIISDGVFANPVRDTAGRWSVPVEVLLNNIGCAPAAVQVKVELLDPAGCGVAAGRVACNVPVLESHAATLNLEVEAPVLWSLETPALYTVEVILSRDGTAVDGVMQHCGFRTLRFDADQGFLLNDRPVKLQGTCNHQDHAGVGVAVPDALWDFRVRRLREMGSNAYRCAHNPPAAEFLDACDRLGMLVIDENRNFNHTPEYLNQLRWMLRRDRNHPCVILWSVFNEEPMQGTSQGREMVRRLVAEVRRLDASRPVISAMNGGMLNEEGAFEAVDVMGFNYCDTTYDDFHRRHPGIPITSSEDTSAFMTRGEFETDQGRNVIAGYDDEHAPWGKSHREAWRAIAERPFLAGGFVWTGFDYRGEPQRLAWPSVSSVFGIMDLCGFPKTAFHVHQADWVRDRPILELAPHWNWPGREGKLVRVIAMTNAGSVSLSLNGESLGEKPRPAYGYVEWQVPYAPGRLEAVAFRNGREVARAVVETAGEAVALELIPDRPALVGDGRDAQPVTVRAVDAAGRVVPRAAPLVTFAVAGPAHNIGHGNGDHNCHDPEQGPERRLFHGLAQVIIQSRPTSGIATVRATAPGLRPAELKLPIEPAPPVPSMPPADPLFALKEWRMSPPGDVKPDALQPMSEADMNTWACITPGTLQKASVGHWALYRINFTPWRGLQKAGGRIHLKRVTGTAEVWLDGRRVAEKPDASPGDLVIDLPPLVGKRALTLLIRSPDEGKLGIPAPVNIAPIPALPFR